MYSLQLRNQEVHQRGLDESNASNKKANLDSSSEGWGVVNLIKSGRLVFGGHFGYVKSCDTTMKTFTNVCRAYGH